MLACKIELTSPKFNAEFPEKRRRITSEDETGRSKMDRVRL